MLKKPLKRPQLPYINANPDSRAVIVATTDGLGREEEMAMFGDEAGVLVGSQVFVDTSRNIQTEALNFLYLDRCRHLNLTRRTQLVPLVSTVFSVPLDAGTIFSLELSDTSRDTTLTLVNIPPLNGLTCMEIDIYIDNARYDVSFDPAINWQFENQDSHMLEDVAKYNPLYIKGFLYDDGSGQENIFYVRVDNK